MAPSTDPQITKSTYRCGSEHSHTLCACLRPDLVFILCQQVGTEAGLIWYVLSLQIIHTDSNTVLGQNDTGFSCDGSANTFRVMFKEPVEILPNVNYTACATLKVCAGSHQTSTARGQFLQVVLFSPSVAQGPDSHYGTKGMRKVTHESSSTGTKTCFTFCYAAGNNNGTSVEDGQIPEVIFYT